MVKTGVAIVGGEITTSAWIDLEAVTRKVIVDIGYNSSEVGFDGATCGVLNLIGKQSPDIAQGVDGTSKKKKKPEEQGAGDQGLMFGYACDETDVLMPAPLYYAHRLVEQQAKVRKQKNSKLPWLPSGCEVAGHPALRERQDRRPRCGGAVDPARSVGQAEGPDRRRVRIHPQAGAASGVAEDAA